MTMLGYSDGADFRDGASYLDIVEFLTKPGSDVDSDLKRALDADRFFQFAFATRTIILRNHGFLLEPGGWKLSPAYDINPVPDAAGLHLNISENDNSLSLELALEVAEYFRLDRKESRSEIVRIKDAVREWPTIAMQLGISRSEQELMRPAFRIAEQADTVTGYNSHPNLKTPVLGEPAASGLRLGRFYSVPPVEFTQTRERQDLANGDLTGRVAASGNSPGSP